MLSVRRRSVRFHSCADDIQLYVSVRSHNTSQVDLDQTEVVGETWYLSDAHSGPIELSCEKADSSAQSCLAPCEA